MKNYLQIPHVLKYALTSLRPQGKPSFREKHPYQGTLSRKSAKKQKYDNIGSRVWWLGVWTLVANSTCKS